MTIHVAPEAEADLAAVIEYLAERNPSAAADLSRRIFDLIDKLARAEFEGPAQSLLTGEPVRSWPVPPVRVFYQRHPDALWVLRIYHQARIPITR